MDSFLNEIFSFPTLLFSLPFVVLMLFWLLALLGVVDLEILDVDADLDTGDADTASKGLAGWLESLGLDGVPLTVVLTLLDIYAFAFTYLARKHLSPLFDGVLSATAQGALIAIVAILVALPLTILCAKPLRRVFHTHEGQGKSELIGTLCTVTTGSVSETFGQAASDDGNLYNVRATTPNDLHKGSRIALIDYREFDDTYSVVSEAELMSMASH